MTDATSTPPKGADGTTLYLKVEGEPGTVKLRTFLLVLGQALDSLTAVDSGVSKAPKGSVDWYVDDLRVASLGAVVSARPKRTQSLQFVPLVKDVFVSGVRELQEGATMPPYFSEIALKKLDAAARFLERDDLPGLQVEDMETHQRATVNQLTHASVTRILAPVHRGIGSVTGTLEMINLHGTPTFNVYEQRTNRAVKCKFTKELQPAITAALDHVVVVRGIVSRNARGDAVSVERPEVEVVETPERFPVSRIIGIDPDFTGDETSTEYTARMRDG